MPPSPARGPTALETLIGAALAGLLLAAALPKFVQIRRQPGEEALYRLHGEFTSAVGRVHGHWLLKGGSATELRVGDAIVHLGETGWPTIDPAHPEQDTARELYELVVREPFPQPDWLAREEPAPRGGRAVYELRGPGGGVVEYDGATGSVSELGSPRR